MGILFLFPLKLGMSVWLLKFMKYDQKCVIFRQKHLIPGVSLSRVLQLHYEEVIIIPIFCMTKLIFREGWDEILIYMLQNPCFF